MGRVEGLISPVVLLGPGKLASFSSSSILGSTSPSSFSEFPVSLINKEVAFNREEETSHSMCIHKKRVALNVSMIKCSLDMSCVCNSLLSGLPNNQIS